MKRIETQEEKLARLEAFYNNIVAARAKWWSDDCDCEADDTYIEDIYQCLVKAGFND